LYLTHLTSASVQTSVPHAKATVNVPIIWISHTSQATSLVWRN